MSQYCDEEQDNDKNAKKRTETFKIESDSLLLVEGKDEVSFFKALLKKMDIKVKDEKSNEGVQIHDAGGCYKFPARFKLLVKDSGFSQVRKLGFVRDAEKNEAKSAFDSICKVLKDTNALERLPCNIGKVEEIGKLKVGIFIMPNNQDKGMLESLCLQSIKDMHCNKEMETYIECLKKHNENNSSFNSEKAKTQVYLASKVPIVQSLGLGACKGYFNFDDPIFDEIRSFLHNLFD